MLEAREKRNYHFPSRNFPGSIPDLPGDGELEGFLADLRFSSKTLFFYFWNQKKYCFIVEKFLFEVWDR